MMTICCSKCKTKDEVDCYPINQYTVRTFAAKLGWYMTLEGELICPDCRLKLRGLRK